MSHDETLPAGVAPIGEAEVRAFVKRLNAWRDGLDQRDQLLLDSLVMAAADTRPDVEGYDGVNLNWIFPPGLVDDLAWIRLSRECRVRGGIEVVLDPGAQGQGARVWGCRAP